MGNVYIEHNRNTGQYEVKVEGNPHPVATAPTQKQAEEKQKQLFPQTKPDVERVKTTPKGVPGEWRKK